MRIMVLLLSISLVVGCGNKPFQLDSDDLTNMLSISNLVKHPIQDPVDSSMMIGVTIDVDVIHTGDFVIDVPFTMTWGLRDGQGALIGSGSIRLVADMSPGARRHVTLDVNFSPRANLNGIQDVVTFDPLPKSE